MHAGEQQWPGNKKCRRNSFGETVLEMAGEQQWPGNKKCRRYSFECEKGWKMISGTSHACRRVTRGNKKSRRNSFGEIVVKVRKGGK